jgi:hypothetical protein
VCAFLRARVELLFARLKRLICNVEQMLIKIDATKLAILFYHFQIFYFKSKISSNLNFEIEKKTIDPRLTGQNDEQSHL